MKDSTVIELIKSAVGYEVSEEWGEPIYRFNFQHPIAEVTLKIWKKDMENLQQEYSSLLSQFNNGAASQ